jgi:hypothetical protein
MTVSLQCNHDTPNQADGTTATDPKNASNISPPRPITDLADTCQVSSVHSSLVTVHSSLVPCQGQNARASILLPGATRAFSRSEYIPQAEASERPFFSVVYIPLLLIHLIHLVYLVDTNYREEWTVTDLAEVGS